MNPELFYMVCATPRCGSSLLDEFLRNSGLAGNPDEYFSPKNQYLLQRSWGKPGFADYVDEVVRRGTSANGVFGMKMMWGYFDRFMCNVQRLAENRLRTKQSALYATFPDLSFIWITRRDKVRQAVSHARARQTNIWSVRSEQDRRVGKQPVFSFQQIDFMVRELYLHDMAWQRYFAIHAIRPYTVVYEDFLIDPLGIVLDILRSMGIVLPDTVVFAPVRLRKQADAESEEWVQRYHDLKKRKGMHQIWASLGGALAGLHTHSSLLSGSAPVTGGNIYLPRTGTGYTTNMINPGLKNGASYG